MRTAALVSALALVTAGCAAATDEATPPVVVAVPRSALAAPACAAGEERRLGNRSVAYAVSLERPTPALARPGGPRIRLFERMNGNGVPTVLAVRAVVRDEACRAAWYRVQLPVRPNGATGYVRAAAVTLHRVATRIEIDLSARRLDFLRGGRHVFRASVAIGAAATPTPLGRYYVNQRLRPTDPGGPFGPGALGISAFSPVLTGWAQSGPVAIHGTNAPASVGRAVSNGCIRLPNDTLERLFGATPAGTPVVIRA